MYKRQILYILSESVGQRLRELGLQCRTVQVSLRGTDLAWYERQAPLTYPSCSSQTLFNTAYALYKANTQGCLLYTSPDLDTQLEHRQDYSPQMEM